MARPTRKMMIIAAAVVAVAAVGGGATYLATSPTALSSSTQAAPVQGKAKAERHGKAERAKARRAERGGAAGGAGGMLGKIEHGEFTTASAGVMQVQRGAITAIDSGSLTVRSADGFTASYTITPTTAVGKGRKGAARVHAVAPVPGAPVPNAAVPGTAAPNGSVPNAAVPGTPAPGVVAPSDPAPGVAPGLSALKAGDTVQVMATKTDTGSNATRIAPTRA